MKKEDFITTDTVIVGSGVAGVFAALCLPKDQNVLVITRAVTACKRCFMDWQKT